ncbi:unnamed protein product [Sphagnum troendelagicum]|uniref:WW domain-containing protein n=1 Tax=Sphagnum troendelagicum TaxID=128251 RepID=A0ABP0UY45_9BRYO
MQFVWVLSKSSCYVLRFLRLVSSSLSSSGCVEPNTTTTTTTRSFGKKKKTVVVMGRSGKIAPRICSTLELRTHAPPPPSSSMALTLPPSSNADAAAPSKQPVEAVKCCRSSPPPPSPATPGQTPPASVKPQAWPQEVLELMQQQVKVLRSSDGGGGVDEAPGKRKRACPAADRDGEEDEAAEEEETLKKQCEKTATAVTEASGIEVELHTQSPLPEDWEQFLDLKTGELYYFHWRSFKRARKDPRELVRQVDESVRALILKAQARCLTPKNEFPQQEPHTPEEEEAPPSDIGFLKEGREQENPSPSQASSGAGEVESVGDSRIEKKKQWKCEDDVREEETKTTRGMVALGCRHCSMFVMLSLSFPSCPSCGEQSLQE